MTYDNKIAIVGGGNIGTAILKGFLASGKIPAGNISITRRKISLLSEFGEHGVNVSSDNVSVVKASDIVILAVLPRQLESVVEEISPVLDNSKILVSVVTAFTIDEIGK